MAEPPADADLPVEDLHRIVDLALARGADLLTAGELLVARRIRELEGAPARVYARLTARVPEVFVVDDLEVPGVADLSGALEHLSRLALVDRAVPWPLRLQALTADVLRELCRERGLKVSGRKAEVIERLCPHPAPLELDFVRVRHQGLVHRLEQWALLRRRPDRSAFVVQRLGHVQWPEYERTRGGGLHPDRRRLRRWERVWAGRDELPPETLLQALSERSEWPPGGLDLRRSLRRRILEAARERERGGDPAAARALYRRMVDEEHVPPERVAVRIARTLEADEQPLEALEHLRAVRSSARGPRRLAIARTGKRIARAVRRGWAPDPPLRKPPERHLSLAEAERPGPRPGYRAAGEVHLVEEAVAAHLRDAGRSVLRGEGPLWTTLFALLFADAYFLPIPGMLPVPFLSGPLDVGTPEFAARRPEAIEDVLQGVRAGEASERIRAADARWRGTWLAGAAWERATADDLATVAETVGPAGLEVVLGRLLAGGWRAASGLPDLVLLPGEPTRIEHGFPSRLDAGPLLVEVKGATDSVRDEQAVWFDRLLDADVPVELWHVEAR